jgi:hypothetical protein
MAEEKARRYLESVNRKGLKTAFVYGNPNRDDIDLCIVSENPGYIGRAPEGIDLKVLTPEVFEERLGIFGRDAVEFRCLVGREYLSEMIRKLNLAIPIK